MNKNSCFFVSVIVPVYNDLERLKPCLESLENQTYPASYYEVVVVDNGSDESVENSVNSYSKAFSVFEAISGSYAARNKGISVARGEILAFTDSDCVPDSNWIESGVKSLTAMYKRGIVAGKIEIFFKDPDSPTAVELYDSVTNLQQEKLANQAKFAATANLFTFKGIFEEVGNFDYKLKSGGDEEWGNRAFSMGYPIVYSADCCVAHPARYSFDQLHKKVVRVTGGFHEKEKLHAKNSFLLAQLTKHVLKLKPPLIYAFRKGFLDANITGMNQKTQVFLVILLVHYWRFWEKTRLLVGGSLRR